MFIALLLRVALAVPPAPVPSAIVHTAIAEAAGVWAPYGVAVDVAAPCGWATDDSAVLTIVPIEARRSAVTPGWHGPLGAITFTRGGEPAPAITVYLTDIEQFIAGTLVFGRPHWQWPTALRDRILGRVLGRVIAHEIGHYVLRSPRHAAEGLMRPRQFADDLVAPSRHRFTLTAAEAARLEEHQ
jgi:hypothetical protein